MSARNCWSGESDAPATVDVFAARTWGSRLGGGLEQVVHEAPSAVSYDGLAKKSGSQTNNNARRNSEDDENSDRQRNSGVMDRGCPESAQTGERKQHGRQIRVEAKTA